MPDRHDDRTPRRTAHRRLGLAALGAVAALCAALPAAPAGAAGKPVAATVSFEAGASVRLDGRRFAGDRVARVNAILAAHPRVRAERLFEASEASLDRRRARVQGKGRRGVPDLNRHFRLVAPDAVERDAVLAALRPLGVVDAAVAEPRPAPAPATPSFAARQRYATSAPAGIDVTAFAGLPGGRGEHVKIVDVEYAWNTAHEELGKAAAAGALVANGTPKDPFPELNGDHGTAVLGELIATDDGAGVTGLAPDSEIGLVNAASVGACPTACWTVADAVTVAHRSMQPGDVMLLEQQFPARESRTAYGPIELWGPVYDAVRLATQDGIIVVEAAGNGGVDLDAPQYGARVPRRQGRLRRDHRRRGQRRLHRARQRAALPLELRQPRGPAGLGPVRDHEQSRAVRVGRDAVASRTRGRLGRAPAYARADPGGRARAECRPRAAAAVSRRAGSPT